MTHSSLSSAWTDDGAAVGGWVTGGGEFSFDIYRRAGYDYVGIDCQHSAFDEAAAAVAATWYAPHGVRSYGPFRHDLPAGDTVAMAEGVSVFVMIETVDGLANVEAICAVPGLAGVYVGPADLSIALGLSPGDAYSTDQLVESVERIRLACAANSIVLGMHQRDADSAAQWIARGARLVSLGGDGPMFTTAAKASLTRAKSL